MSENNAQAAVEAQGQPQTSEQEDEQQRSLQHPHLPANLVSVADQADANPILQASMQAAANDQSQQAHEGHAEAVKDEQVQQQQAHTQQTEQHVGQEFTQADQENQSAANFFDQNYQPYDFPASSAALNAANNANVATTFPFHPHPHPQHPHLGVEALGHAAAASQHAGRVPVPGVSAPEGDGGNHVFNSANGADHSMDLTMSSTAGDTTNASEAQLDRSSGKAPRTSLSVPGSDGSGAKKETPYSRSPDMRNSHKLAERKRRKEMKDLFDDLRDQLPVDKGPKTSKWEILCKAVEHINALRKERDDMAVELHALRGGEPGQAMTGVEEAGVAPPPPAEEGNDDYSKYEQQQVASQQQVEAAAAAANQFTAHHEYTQPSHEEQQQQHAGHAEAEYKPDHGQQQQPAHEAVQAVHEQTAPEQDWGAIAAQAAQAQSAQ